MPALILRFFSLLGGSVIPVSDADHGGSLMLSGLLNTPSESSSALPGIQQCSSKDKQDEGSQAQPDNNLRSTVSRCDRKHRGSLGRDHSWEL